MNEFATLQTLRDEVEAPTPAQLAPAFERLNRAMVAESTAKQAQAPASVPAPVPASTHVSAPRRTGRKVAWSLGGVAGAIALTLAGGNVAMAVNSAQTQSLLHDIAGATVEFRDATPGPGEFLLSSTHTLQVGMSEQQIDVYMPADPNAEWTLVRDWGADVAVSAPAGSNQHVELLTAPKGDFYAPLNDPSPAPAERPGWLGVDPAEIPLESAEATYAWVDGQYTGGSKSRAEDNFDRIHVYLRSGLLPAPQRAALLEALALVPGVSSTANVANLDGAVGVAFGRTEALRNDERTEVLIDPATGLVIGERMISGSALFGFGVGGVVWNTAIDTRVVASAPTTPELAERR